MATATPRSRRLGQVRCNRRRDAVPARAPGPRPRPARPSRNRGRAAARARVVSHKPLAFHGSKKTPARGVGTEDARKCGDGGTMERLALLGGNPKGRPFVASQSVARFSPTTAAKGRPSNRNHPSGKQPRRVTVGRRERPTGQASATCRRHRRAACRRPRGRRWPGGDSRVGVVPGHPGANWEPWFWARIPRRWGKKKCRRDGQGRLGGEKKRPHTAIPPTGFSVGPPRAHGKQVFAAPRTISTSPARGRRPPAQLTAHPAARPGSQR